MGLCSSSPDHTAQRDQRPGVVQKQSNSHPVPSNSHPNTTEPYHSQGPGNKHGGSKPSSNKQRALHEFKAEELAPGTLAIAHCGRANTKVLLLGPPVKRQSRFGDTTVSLFAIENPENNFLQPDPEALSSDAMQVNVNDIFDDDLKLTLLSPGPTLQDCEVWFDQHGFLDAKVLKESENKSVAAVVATYPEDSTLMVMWVKAADFLRTKMDSKECIPHRLYAHSEVPESAIVPGRVAEFSICGSYGETKQAILLSRSTSQGLDYVVWHESLQYIDERSTEVDVDAVSFSESDYRLRFKETDSDAKKAMGDKLRYFSERYQMYVAGVVVHRMPKAGRLCMLAPWKEDWDVACVDVVKEALTSNPSVAKCASGYAIGQEALVKEFPKSSFIQGRKIQFYHNGDWATGYVHDFSGNLAVNLHTLELGPVNQHYLAPDYGRVKLLEDDSEVKVPCMEFWEESTHRFYECKVLHQTEETSLIIVNEPYLQCKRVPNTDLQALSDEVVVAGRKSLMKNFPDEVFVVGRLMEVHNGYKFVRAYYANFEDGNRQFFAVENLPEEIGSRFENPLYCNPETTTMCLLEDETPAPPRKVQVYNINRHKLWTEAFVFDERPEEEKVLVQLHDHYKQIVWYRTSDVRDARSNEDIEAPVRVLQRVQCRQENQPDTIIYGRVKSIDRKTNEVDVVPQGGYYKTTFKYDLPEADWQVKPYELSPDEEKVSGLFQEHLSGLKLPSTASVMAFFKEHQRLPTYDEIDNDFDGAFEDIVVISHPWWSRAHPDPDGDQFEILLNNLVSNHKHQDWEDVAEEGIHPSYYTFVFYDFFSLPQAPRDEERTEIFQRCLKRMDVLFAHARMVFTSQVLSSGDHVEPYLSRSWCRFEYLLNKLSSQTMTHVTVPQAPPSLDHNSVIHRINIEQCLLLMLMRDFPELHEEHIKSLGGSVFDETTVTNEKDKEVVKQLFMRQCELVARRLMCLRDISWRDMFVDLADTFPDFIEGDPRFLIASCVNVMNQAFRAKVMKAMDVTDQTIQEMYSKRIEIKNETDETFKLKQGNETVKVKPGRMFLLPRAHSQLFTTFDIDDMTMRLPTLLDYSAPVPLGKFVEHCRSSHPVKA